MSDYDKLVIRKELSELEQLLKQKNEESCDLAKADAEAVNGKCKCGSSDIINRVIMHKDRVVNVNVCKSCEHEWLHQAHNYRMLCLSDIGEFLCHFVYEMQKIQNTQLEASDIMYDNVEQKRANLADKLMSSYQAQQLQLLRGKSFQLCRYIVETHTQNFYHGFWLMNDSPKDCLEKLGVFYKL